MTKVELLKTYLADDLFNDKDYLKNVDVDKINWRDLDNSKLVSVIKLAIEGEDSREGDGITTRKINQLLNSQK